MLIFKKRITNPRQPPGKKRHKYKLFLLLAWKYDLCVLIRVGFGLFWLSDFKGAQILGDYPEINLYIEEKTKLIPSIIISVI